MHFEQNEIFLFNHGHSLGPSNTLKHFFSLLKYFGHSRRDIKFSFSNGNGSLHSNITVRDNLDLEAIPTSISLHERLKTKDLIDSIKNEYLKKLVSRITPLERLPSQLNEEELKIASIVKTLMSQSNYIFMESPDKGISSSNIGLVKKCLLHEVTVNKRTVIISTPKPNHWIDIINKIITREDNYTYSIKTNEIIGTQTPDNVIVIGRSSKVA